VSAGIDWARRYTVMRHHTLLHLCHLATLDLLDEPPRVIGSQVREEKARLDYDYHGELNGSSLTQAVEAFVAADLPVVTEPVGDGGLSRQWRIPGYPPIPCGGTHVKRTSELGKVAIKVQRKGRQGTRIYCNVLDQD
jgi:Ser-tRNA(Ala) deacylase AlaX